MNHSGNEAGTQGWTQGLKRLAMNYNTRHTEEALQSDMMVVLHYPANNK